ncbi:helix-turn-helix domain-containing protein [Streptomyces sp. H39-C1]|uniref:helix-turn-helix domain-containing protein n=1 Tax=Streptomyces sp. H39-C1 TaxID=3004355 RepID=UPI0022AFA354|nr:helix-turn-helix transcriptional regulator [Streptomyces sp. H39-C1]MCZ4100933.1 helix-turn-helix transcriptional regulator [Streptomyces sp. H39-C1]
MPRRRLDPAAQLRGQALAFRLTQARRTSGRSAEAVARSAGISVETVRSIEKGRTFTPEFFTVAALAVELGLSLDELYALVRQPTRSDLHTLRGPSTATSSPAGPPPDA